MELKLGQNTIHHKLFQTRNEKLHVLIIILPYVSTCSKHMGRFLLENDLMNNNSIVQSMIIHLGPKLPFVQFNSHDQIRVFWTS